MSESPVASVRLTMFVIAATALFSQSALGKDPAGRVFRCEINGKITFSDSVCEKAPDKREVSVGSLNGGSVTTPKGTTTIHAPPASKAPPSGKSKPLEIRPNNTSAAQSQADKKMRCKDLSMQLDGIKKSLKDGNGLRDMGESMRLSDERQRLEQESKNQKCE